MNATTREAAVVPVGCRRRETFAETGSRTGSLRVGYAGFSSTVVAIQARGRRQTLVTKSLCELVGHRAARPCDPVASPAGRLVDRRSRRRLELIGLGPTPAIDSRLARHVSDVAIFVSEATVLILRNHLGHRNRPVSLRGGGDRGGGQIVL